MSALPPKADILRAVAKSLLLTQSGHSCGASTSEAFRRWDALPIAIPPPGQGHSATVGQRSGPCPGAAKPLDPSEVEPIVLGRIHYAPEFRRQEIPDGEDYWT